MHPDRGFNILSNSVLCRESAANTGPCGSWATSKAHATSTPINYLFSLVSVKKPSSFFVERNTKKNSVGSHWGGNRQSCWLLKVHNHCCVPRKRSYSPPASSARWPVLEPSTIPSRVGRMNCACQLSVVGSILVHTWRRHIYPVVVISNIAARLDPSLVCTYIIPHCLVFSAHMSFEGFSGTCCETTETLRVHPS